jgi:hypothetical protein
VPTLTRWYIKAALLYLAAALLLALLLAVNRVADLPRFVSLLSPAYFHFFLLGWVTQMIFGVGYWMFPIIDRERLRGSDLVGWTTFATLNVGLLLRLVAEPAIALTSAAAWGVVLAVGATLQWISGLLFVVSSWPRIKGR